MKRIGAAALVLLLLSGCAGRPAASTRETDGDALSIAALFQTERGDALHGSAVQLSTETGSHTCQVDRDGTASISDLPRDGELVLTLSGQHQEVQGTMTLSLSQGAVIDATTGEDGVGYITLRGDTREVALLFVLTEDGALQCTLWLAEAAPSQGDPPQKGV